MGQQTFTGFPPDFRSLLMTAPEGTFFYFGCILRLDRRKVNRQSAQLSVISSK
jgi:hypothetical protein